MGEDGDLTKCTDTLLRNPGKLGKWLSVADKHMQSYAQEHKKSQAEKPITFLLPKAHAFMRPLIETYASNIEAFTEYLIGLRDRFDRNSAAYKEVQKVYRRINGRYIQQQRRERMERAVAKAEKLYGKIPFMQRMQWMAKLEHQWAKQRLDFLEAQRARHENDRLPAEDRVERLAEFWENIDTEINEGKLPNWNLPNPGATQP